MEPIRCVGVQGPSRLFSLIAAFMADYSPLTQTVLLLPGKVPLPPRGADWGPQGRGGGEHGISEWASVECLLCGSPWDLCLQRKASQVPKERNLVGCEPL